MEYKQYLHHEQLTIYHNNKIVIPVKIQTRLIEWSHEQLLHPRMKQHIHWKTIAKDIANFTNTCKECQIFQQDKHYRKLHDLHPWNQVCIDLIGPWNINTTDNPVTLLALTILVLATSCFVINPLPNK